MLTSDQLECSNGYQTFEDEHRNSKSVQERDS
jgi:hypothetical protein